MGDPAPVIAAMRAAGVGRCVVNATHEGDWAAVAALAAAEPDFVVPSFGIHPWHAHTAAPGWQDRLEECLRQHPLAGVGECGLDQWISTPSLDVQMPVFLDQIRIARVLGRPLTVHCLKAWGPLLDAFSREVPPRFLMHSFGGSLETARRLIPMGAWFSCSGNALLERKSALREVLRQLPKDRLLLETDAPDMAPPEPLRSHALEGSLNHPANLPSIGGAMAACLDMELGEFAELTRDNTRRWLTGA